MEFVLIRSFVGSNPAQERQTGANRSSFAMLRRIHQRVFTPRAPEKVAAIVAACTYHNAVAIKNTDN